MMTAAELDSRIGAGPRRAETDAYVVLDFDDGPVCFEFCGEPQLKGVPFAVSAAVAPALLASGYVRPCAAA